MISVRGRMSPPPLIPPPPGGKETSPPPALAAHQGVENQHLELLVLALGPELLDFVFVDPADDV